MAPIKAVLPLVLATMATLAAARPGPKFGPPHGFPGPFGGWGGPWEPIPIDDVLPEPAISSSVTEVVTAAPSVPMVVGTATALATAGSGYTSFQDASSVMVTVVTVTAPSAAAPTATAIDTSNPDWDPEAGHCKDDDEECKQMWKEADAYAEELQKTYRPTRTVTPGGYSASVTATSLVARSETVKAVDIATATATATVTDTPNPDWDPEASHCDDDDEDCKQMWKEADEYYKELTKTYRPTRTATFGDFPNSATPTTMVTEFLKPQETKIAAPVGASDVENFQCLGLDCGLSA